MFAILFPALLSTLIIAAHFFRFGEPGLVCVALLSSALLLFKRRWALRSFQFLLAVAGVVWIHTLLRLATWRFEMGEPWIRLSLILGGVALFTVFSAWLLGREKCLARFRCDGSLFVRVWTFSLTAVLLGVVHVAANRSPVGPMLLVERFFPTWGWLEVFFLAVYAAFISGNMLQVRGVSVLRNKIWALFSAVFFGQLVLGLWGVLGEVPEATRFLMTGNLHLPIPALILAGPLFRGGGFFMLILFAVTILLVGPAWCSHLCYIGAWDSVLATKMKRPKKLPLWRESLRRWILLGVVVLALGLRFMGVEGVWAAVASAVFGIAGVVLMFVGSRKTGMMIHCTSYCPIGVMATVVGRVSPFRFKINSSCTDCGACTLACRYDALKREDIQKRRAGISCTLCGDCMSRCKPQSLEYQFFALKGPRARALFIVLIVSLHALFLGVARM
ncbi:4Fe-4S binding protein [Bdellovibrionota bacterium FG-2]